MELGLGDEKIVVVFSHITCPLTTRWKKTITNRAVSKRNSVSRTSMRYKTKLEDSHALQRLHNRQSISPSN